MSARISRRRQKKKVTSGNIPKSVGTSRAGVTVLKHTNVRDGAILDVEVLVNGLTFTRSYTVNKKINRNEMEEFIANKIREEQDSILVSNFVVEI